ncbi:GNAT family N-acetyltransferase [Brenneria populi]|uniref:GNAT family N-acetyltransferase n=1 Tax=Brenneria populi TaxID=1505588 RepID=A0ABU6JSX2_9GAMM|nr:GNAT family N-acetyltransferase [Brenneria populi Li et al. 2015]
MPREFVIPAKRRPTLNSAFSFSPLELHADIDVLHPWYQMDYAFYWNMQGLSLEQTRAFYVNGREHGLTTYMGFYQGAPAFVMECYDPSKEPVGKNYAVQPGDIGMHFFVGPSCTPVHNFTLDVLRNVMAFLFDELHARRVVVEPDIRNSKVHRLNTLVGFTEAGTVELPGKTALLAFCTPQDFDLALK